jgi:hypothetical protein
MAARKILAFNRPRVLVWPQPAKRGMAQLSAAFRPFQELDFADQLRPHEAQLPGWQLAAFEHNIPVDELPLVQRVLDLLSVSGVEHRRLHHKPILTSEGCGDDELVPNRQAGL